MKVAPTIPVAPVAETVRPSVAHPGWAAMESLVAHQAQSEKALDAAASGQRYQAAELLALQVQVYRFTQELEVASKVVEASSSTLRQLLGAQV